METWYFVAPSDAVAIATLSWSGGPFWAAPELRAQLLAEPVRGPQAADDLMSLAPALLGRRGRRLEVDRLAESRMGQLVVLSRIPRALVRAVAAHGQDALGQCAASPLRVVQEASENGLADVVEHARIAEEAGAGLYAFAHS